MILLAAEKAKELASKVGGKAITLEELENFHPENGMILANTTSVGMKPNTDRTPLAKVCHLVPVKLQFSAQYVVSNIRSKLPELNPLQTDNCLTSLSESFEPLLPGLRCNLHTKTDPTPERSTRVWSHSSVWY